MKERPVRLFQRQIGEGLPEALVEGADVGSSIQGPGQRCSKRISSAINLTKASRSWPLKMALYIPYMRLLPSGGNNRGNAYRVFLEMERSQFTSSKMWIRIARD